MKVLAKSFVITNEKATHNVVALRYFPDRYNEVQIFKSTLHTPCPGDMNTFFHDLDTGMIDCDVFRFPYSMALRYINANWESLKSGDEIESEDICV